MKDMTEEEEAKAMLKAYNEITAEDQAASVRAISEAASQVSALGLASCCLEVSGVEALIKRWEEEARYTNYRLVQATLNRCASDLRREMGAAKSRQPQDNASMTDR